MNGVLPWAVWIFYGTLAALVGLGLKFGAVNVKTVHFTEEET
eukprot:COSAG02_NODE_41373_length_395_cov_0.861486_1_plen_41_part_10